MKQYRYEDFTSGNGIGRVMLKEKCIACGSDRRETAFDLGDTRIYRCPSCGLGVADPIPAREDLKKRYEAEYYETGYSEGIERRPSEAAARLLLPRRAAVPPPVRSAAQAAD